MRENKSRKRIEIFDIAKGVSIILMTLSHYPFTEIYSNLMNFQSIAMIFKMPTFIFISGYLFSDRLSFKSFFYHKTDSLIKPLIGFLITLTLLQILFYIIFSDIVTLKVGMKYITSLAAVFVYGNLGLVNYSFWFVGALFLSQIIFKIKDIKKPYNYLFLAFSFVISFIFYYSKIKFYYLGYIAIFVTYLFLGYGFKKISIRYFNGISFFYSKKMILFPILFFISILGLNKLGFETNLDLSEFQFNYHYLLLLSIFGVFTVIYFCSYIEKIPLISSLLVYCSKASFFILGFNVLIIDICASFFDLRNYNPVLHTFLFFLNIVVCCLIYMLVKKIPYVRILFYPIKSILLNDAEVKLLRSKYIYRLIPKDIFLMANIEKKISHTILT